MQEICQSGSEGGGTEINRFSLPLSNRQSLDKFGRTCNARAVPDGQRRRGATPPQDPVVTQR
jgi:hypothetical protein